MQNIRLALSYKDVLLVPQFSTIRSRSEVDLKTHIAPDIEIDLPFLAVNMDTLVDERMAIALSQLGSIACIPKFDKPEVQAALIQKVKEAGARCIGCVGVNEDYINRAGLLIEAGATGLTIDTPHAHTSFTLDAVEKIKKAYPKTSLIVGTIATYPAAMDLFNAGADSVRVGIGAGTICTTRIAAGSGVPQITAIMNAVRAKYKNKYVLADGGCSSSGDIVKALACGADGVMVGSLLAGTDETPGEMITINGKQYKEYNGSTSSAEKKRQMSKDMTNKHEKYHHHVEGVEAMVPHKGPVKDIVARLEAGVRSGFSYSGARSLSELWQRAEFIQISSAGYEESTPHDVIVR